MKPGGRNKRSLDDAKSDQKSKKQTTIVTKTVLEAIEAGETPGIKQGTVLITCSDIPHDFFPPKLVLTHFIDLRQFSLPLAYPSFSTR